MAEPEATAVGMVAKLAEVYRDGGASSTELSHGGSMRPAFWVREREEWGGNGGQESEPGRGCG